MDKDVVIILINLVVSGCVGFFAASFKIGEYKNKVDTLETNMGKDDHCGLRKTTGDIKTEVDKLLEFKTNTQKFIDKNLYKDQSPLSLTEFGKKLVEESGFQNIFLNVREDLASKLSEKNPKTKYDVQEMARSLMDELNDYIAFQPMKTYAFEHGKDYGQILRAGAILLRDYYLDLHKEITQE